MSETHKHKGVTRLDGTLRSHPITQKHRDKQVNRYHSSTIATAARLAKISKAKTSRIKISPSRVRKPVTRKPTVKKPAINSRDEIKKLLGKDITVKVNEAVMCPVDKDGFIMLDLTEVKQKGVRVKFVRTEGRKKRTVGLEIEK